MTSYKSQVLVWFTMLSLISVDLCLLQAQEAIGSSIAVDSLYREDQLYIGLSLDLLSNRPEGVSQNGYSGGFQLGFVRDMPFNTRRNKAIGIGLGLAVDIFNQNLFIGEEEDGASSIYSVIGSDVDKTKNRLSFYTVEMPIEYRWRTSTPSEYTFWRVHAGVQLGYIYYFKSVFEQPGNIVTQTDLPELNRFQYGLTFAFGYSAFNLKMYYGLNTLFNDQARVNSTETVDLQIIRLGIQFYFL